MSQILFKPWQFVALGKSSPMRREYLMASIFSVNQKVSEGGGGA